MKKFFWALLDVLILVAIVNVVFFVMPLLSRWAGSFYPARTMTVVAEGKTTASPDLAEISFSVVSQGQDPGALATDNNDKMSAVLRFVKLQGIADADTKTTDYNLAPNYQYDKNTRRSYIAGYTLTQTVQVKVRDLGRTAPVVGGLAPLGVNQVGGIVFTFADREKVLAAARADAFAKAEAKAEEMARGAGVSLGRIVNVGESGNAPVPRPYYALAESASQGGVAASLPPIQPGTQDITDQITITYELK